MYINLIDLNGNEETVYIYYTEEFKKKAFSKQNELNKIGILICESYTPKFNDTIPDNLIKKAVSILCKN